MMKTIRVGTGGVNVDLLGVATESMLAQLSDDGLQQIVDRLKVSKRADAADALVFAEKEAARRGMAPAAPKPREASPPTSTSFSATPPQHRPEPDDHEVREAYTDELFERAQEILAKAEERGESMTSDQALSYARMRRVEPEYVAMKAREVIFEHAEMGIQIDACDAVRIVKGRLGLA
jgi:hypothetical protein